MKPVFMLLLIALGITIDYMVLIGKLPNTGTQSPSGSGPDVLTGGALPTAQNYSRAFNAYTHPGVAGHPASTLGYSPNGFNASRGY